MATSDQMTGPALRELLDSATLAGEWSLDPSRSTVALKSRSMGVIVVTGVFRQVTGKGSISPAGEVTGSLIVAAASIDTNQAKRDKHLRSADFFETENYPDITFTVTGIRPSAEDVTVTGTLSVRGRARPLSFPAAAAVKGGGEIWLGAQVQINRADFGLTWNLLGTVSMKNTLTIHAVFTRT
jgi:polyisoprenoid-binding protein YceI